jgi:hypothetical protein
MSVPHAKPIPPFCRGLGRALGHVDGAGHPVSTDKPPAGYVRFYVDSPFGNWIK